MHRISIVDSHTGGEPTRVVVSGGPELGDGTVAERARVFRDRFDRYRSAIVNEPRGSDVLVGALLCQASDRTCVAGAIFFNNVGLLGMCGHGTIGLIVTLAHLGRIGVGAHRIETPVGVVSATLNEDGSVTVGNVASHRKAKAVPIDVPGHGSLTGDVAYGGNWFFISDDHGCDLELSNVESLVAFSWRVRQAVNTQGFPEVDHVEFVSKSRAGSRNFVLCPGKAYDRSPCGTGTSAKLACLAADGKFSEGEEHVVESIIGSRFIGTFRWVDREKGIVAPNVTGTAHIVAEGTLLLDESDPFCWGIRESQNAESPEHGARLSKPQKTPSNRPATSRKKTLHEHVEQRQSWHAPAISKGERESGFEGWRTRGYLPHFDRKGIYQFVTFRLNDALPRDRAREWKGFFEIDEPRERLRLFEGYLDSGRGGCALQQPDVATLVEQALLKFDGQRYRLFAWCVMPNHVHVLVEPTTDPLKSILHSWKAFTALEVNRMLNRSGAFWQPEYFDRYIRDQEHFRKTLRYIEANPVKAGLVKSPEEWPWSSARFANAGSERIAGIDPAGRLRGLQELEEDD